MPDVVDVVAAADVARPDWGWEKKNQRVSIKWLCRVNKYTRALNNVDNIKWKYARALAFQKIE